MDCNLTKLLENGPVIILVRPQLGENIGMCCRAMLNNGLKNLRLVKPRDGWPNSKANAAAAGADIVIKSATVYDTVHDAIYDLNKVYATTARLRDSAQKTVAPSHIVSQMCYDTRNGTRLGVLFGPESMGLENDEVVLADAIISIPVNPTFQSLNLSHAVYCIAYEWSQSVHHLKLLDPPYKNTKNKPATKKNLIYMFEHLELELEKCGFLRPKEKRKAMVQNIRVMLQKARFTEQEVRTMRGIISGLTRKHNKGS